MSLTWDTINKVISVVVVVAVICVLYIWVVDGRAAGKAKRARWRKECPPAYAVGDVLRSKLDRKLVVDGISMRGKGRYKYTCFYIKKYGDGYEKRTWDLFWEHEIAGKWKDK